MGSDESRCEYSDGKWKCPLTDRNKLFQADDGQMYCAAHIAVMEKKGIGFNGIAGYSESNAHDVITKYFATADIESTEKERKVWAGFVGKRLNLVFDAEKTGVADFELLKVEVEDLTITGFKEIDRVSVRRVKAKNFNLKRMSSKEVELESIKKVDVLSIGENHDVTLNKLRINASPVKTLKVSCIVPGGPRTYLAVTGERDEEYNQIEIDLNESASEVIERRHFPGRASGWLEFSGIKVKTLKYSDFSFGTALTGGCEVDEVYLGKRTCFTVEESKITDKLHAGAESMVSIGKNSLVRHILFPDKTNEDTYLNISDSKCIRVYVKSLKGVGGDWNTFGTFQLDSASVEYVDVSNIRFLRDISVHDSTVGREFIASGAEFTEDLLIEGNSRVAGLDLNGATFRKAVSLCGSRLHAPPDFRGTNIGTSLIFDNGTTFDITKQKSPQKNQFTSSKFAALREAMTANKMERESGYFHRLEMLSEAKNDRFPRLSLVYLYEISSKCGQSAMRPLIWLVAAYLFFAFVYTSLLGRPCLSSESSCSIDWDILEFSGENIFRPFSTWAERSYVSSLEHITGGKEVIVKLIATLQSAAGAGLIALSLFALRRRLKLPR